MQTSLQCKHFVIPQSAISVLDKTFVVRCPETGEVLACVVASVNEGKRVVHVGPLATDPKHQVYISS